MSLVLKINPVEIPELLRIIGCHLSTGDQKSCMLVSRTWYTLFRAYYWSHLYYNRLGIPNIEKYGHLVRWLTTFWITDADLLSMAGSCHLVQRLDLELSQFASSSTVEILVGNMPHIQELNLCAIRIELKHLIPVVRLKRLWRLRLGFVDGYRSSLCDFKLLLNVLQECPSLTILQLERLGEDGSYQPSEVRQSEDDSKPPSLPPLPPPPETAIGRFVQRLTNRSSRPNPNKLSRALRAREPWRKFVTDTTIKIPSKIPDKQLLRQPDASEFYSKLTTLHFKHVWSSYQSNSTIGILFKKSPYLQELYLDVKELRDWITCECLDAITDSCYQLQTLAVEGLHSKYNTSSSVQRFFRQHRPNLKHLKLKNCANLDYVLELIPSTTVAQLERICFDCSIYSHPIFHRFMTQPSSLQYIAWIFSEKKYFPPRERIDAFLEPWGCYETMRHVEQRNCVSDEGSLEAFLNRLALMRRLVSLSMSIEDIRRSIAFMIKECLKQRNEGNQADEKSTQESNESKFVSPNHEEDTADVIMDSKPLETVQELTISQIQNASITRAQDSAQFNLTEVRDVLDMFPRLRKIRYQGNVYPLDQSAREYLENLESRRIVVIHISQFPSSVL
ncbi:hypothetical protein BGX26_010550 [Mortierella sp. AD094]|nr:hypothetical protein BGX26_010550 [Mortierella sp. AD094]